MYREEFRDIKGYKVLYQISNAGRIKSLKRIVMRSNGRKTSVKEKILKQHLVGPKRKQYLAVGLRKNGKLKTYKVHQLIMNHFKPNPNPKIYTEIDHIRNGDVLCNFVTSLEWVTHSENQRKRFRRDNKKPSIPKKGISGIKAVLQFTKNGKFITEYESIMEAERVTSINHSNISGCCKGNKKNSHAGGFVWKYKKSLKKT